MAVTVRLRYVLLALFGIFAVQAATIPLAVSLAEQGPAADSEARSPLGQGFTYQGRLATNAAPPTGAFDFEFRLWDQAAAGIQVGPVVTANGVDVVNGLFTVNLNFGDNAFEGSDRYLEVKVRQGAADFELLGARQPLTATPYALYARSIPLAGDGTATTAARSDHDHFGQTWTGAASTGFFIENTDPSEPVGVPIALEAEARGEGVALMGQNLEGGYGVVGVAKVDTVIPLADQRGIGVVGRSLGTLGIAPLKEGNFAGSGVYGESHAGPGVAGYSSNYYGVLGEGAVAGVVGEGGLYGVYAASDSFGILGESRGDGSGLGGFGPGVTGFTQGRENASSVAGVTGRNGGACNTVSNSIGDYCLGVLGVSQNGSATIGVYGRGGRVGVSGEGTVYAGYFIGNLGYTGQLIPPTSDARLKADFASLDVGLDVVLALKPSLFSWNTPAPWDEEGRLHAGFIAQDVREVFPSAVSESEDGTLHLDYNELVVVLTRAVQEQQAQIDDIRGAGTSSPVNEPETVQPSASVANSSPLVDRNAGFAIAGALLSGLALIAASLRRELLW